MEEGDTFTGKTFGIVTDAEKWYFLECSYNEGKFEDLQAKVEKVLGLIAWLLEEVQKPMKGSQSGVKRVRSTGNLAN